MCENYNKPQIDYKKEKDELSELYKNRIIYSLPVRAGYWSNELAIREQLEFSYNYKREHCQLLIQKTRKMFRNLLRPTVLSSDTPHIAYNVNYQIKSYGIKQTHPCGKDSLQPLYLSGVITEREIESTQHFTHGCVLTASPDRSPCIRNTFVFVGCDSDKSGNVNYGEDVYIEISGSGGPPLYVQCENSTMDTFGKHPSLRLSRVPDIYCRFKILHWKPQLRDETSGTFVLYNTYVIVQHTASGHNLAAEFHNWMPTFFGSECATACHTFRDTHRMETSENLWKIVGHEKTDLDHVQLAQIAPNLCDKKE
ncbi:cilia- and flagella-associated protein 161 [Tribolium castaneum]|uniref:Uncharacterized protein C15orf26-like Protein n=1 Tax=Tribolium castaneum TaxID=7070 RepID=D6X240_TRICA|nr:PREDICTED: uncharacterized protein C15orf26 [Tribolium castaneum]EFA10210.1 Uncharacterized protein C15orf26-like Protein [Tribolium castaneum]|eukprot:XP_973013.1 PREDICTED: uncharacterized protein C15orf26 [Tribolium castaneum]